MSPINVVAERVLPLLTNNYFNLFALQEQYAINVDTLKENYLKLQKQVHPDRFIEAGSHAKHLAVTYASEINQAYRTLMDPILRARYILKQKGIELKETTSIDNDFLIEQMELREELMEIMISSSVEKLDKFKKRINETQSQLAKAMGFKLDANELNIVTDMLNKMQFYAKLEEEIQRVESSWDS